MSKIPWEYSCFRQKKHALRKKLDTLDFRADSNIRQLSTARSIEHYFDTAKCPFLALKMGGNNEVYNFINYPEILVLAPVFRVASTATDSEFATVDAP